MIKRFGLIFLSIITLVFSGMAQPEPSLFHSSMSHVITTQRFQANAVLKLNQKVVAWNTLPNSAYWNAENVTISYSSDSVNWLMPFNGKTYSISFPNDVSVFYGQDRKEMQDKLIAILDSHRSITLSENSSPLFQEKIIDTVGLRYGLLRQNTYRNAKDSLYICNVSMPFESLMNAFKDTSACNGLYPMKLVFHRYGMKQDTIRTDVPSLLKTLGAVGWPVWNNRQENEIALLIQHPFWGFDHVLFLKLHENLWQGDFYSFVPNHNLLNMYKSYDSKSATSIKYKIE